MIGIRSNNQDLSQQRAVLQAVGCPRIYEEKVSGAKRDRPQLARLIDQIRPDDVVTITRLDRLARSTRDLLDIAERLEGARAGLRSLAEPWADTTSPAGRMVLTVFAGIAEFERALIAERTGTGAIVLTFLAGAELDPAVFRRRWREAGAIGLVSFLVPFLACAAAAHSLLGWTSPASWLAGVALPTTSVAVVYAVILESGLNATEYGKVLLGACFVTDLGTVPAGSRRHDARRVDHPGEGPDAAIRPRNHPPTGPAHLRGAGQVVPPWIAARGCRATRAS